ncbi:MAG: hypothetical protein JO061_18050 [Acidobacteriaceae bacterium]|nr:hypothetical protein [Acidobacteriaceae bacterium]
MRRPLSLGFVFSTVLFALPLLNRGRWTELNIGPFYVDADGDTGAAREYLTQLEQLRWVLGGLLESKDLPSRWPFRIILTKDEKTNPAEFVRKCSQILPDCTTEPDRFVPQFGQYLIILKPGSSLPLAQVARLLLDANTPRIPPDAESGLAQLLGSLEAHGSHVTWGGPVAHPDLAWARMQLFATKFEYGASFHIFVTSLKDGSSVRVAERNAFNRDPDALEKEAAANLAAGNWQSVPVSGRPLDPKRDFGEHTVETALVEAFLASPGTSPEAAYKAALTEEGTAMPIGYEGLAGLAAQRKEDPLASLEDAIRSGSKSAPVYVVVAKSKSPQEAQPLLKRAISLAPLWAQPIYEQAQLAATPLDKEMLLKKATQIEPRQTRYWIELAELQLTDGHALSAQTSWLKAEDSAPTPQERDRIHETRLAREQQRLDAAKAERRHERDEVHEADQRAQDAELARIHAAEAKANSQLDTEAGRNPCDVVPWQDVVPKRSLKGTIISIECGKDPERVSIRDKTGKTTTLLLDNPEAAGLACGAKQPARRVSVSYAAQPDDQFHAAGRVLTIETQ